MEWSGTERSAGTNKTKINRFKQRRYVSDVSKCSRTMCIDISVVRNMPPCDKYVYRYIGMCII